MDTRAIELQNQCDQLLKKITSELPNNPLLILDAKHSLSFLKSHLDIIVTSTDPLCAENTLFFVKFLADRWEKILLISKLIYTNTQHQSITKLYLQLARLIAPFYNKIPYQLLMPTIEVICNDISATQLSELQLHEFTLSDDNKRYIDVSSCLQFAEQDGLLKHTSSFDGQAKKLSESEANRIIHHSKFTEEYYSAIIKYVDFKKNGASFGTALFTLKENLYNGGSEKKGWDYEYDAGKEANIGIASFSKYLDLLTSDEQALLLSFTAPDLPEKNFGEIWKLLARPIDSDYRQVAFCTGNCANGIDLILDANPMLYNIYPKNSVASDIFIEDLIEVLHAKKEILDHRLQQSDYQVQCSYDTYENFQPLFCGIFQNGVQLINGLQQLTRNHRIMLIKVLNNNLANIIQSGEQLADIIRALPIHNRSTVITAMKHKFQFLTLRESLLNDIMQMLPNEEDQIALQNNVNIIKQNLHSFFHFTFTHSSHLNVYDYSRIESFSSTPAENLGKIIGMTLSMDGNILAVATQEKLNNIHLIDVHSNQKIMTFLGDGFVYDDYYSASLSITHDNNYLIVSYHAYPLSVADMEQLSLVRRGYSLIDVWDIKNQAKLRFDSLLDHRTPLPFVHLVSNHEFIVGHEDSDNHYHISRGNSSLFLYNIITKTRTPYYYDASNDPFFLNTACSPDSKLFARITCPTLEISRFSNHCHLTLYDTQSGHKISNMPILKPNSKLIFLANNPQILYINDESGIQLVNYITKESTTIFIHPSNDVKDNFKNIALSADDHYLAIADCPKLSIQTHQISIWDLKTGRCIHSFSQPNVCDIFFSRDNASLFSLHQDGKINIFNFPPLLQSTNHPANEPNYNFYQKC